jgi:hypothetical protein
MKYRLVKETDHASIKRLQYIIEKQKNFLCYTWWSRSYRLHDKETPILFDIGCFAGDDLRIAKEVLARLNNNKPRIEIEIIS